MPAPHALEADRVQHGNAREQQQLDEREERAEEPGDAPEAREQPREVVDLAQPALAPPQPDDDDRVGGDEHRHVPAGDPAPGAAEGRVACDRDGAWRVP
jgi:hypothetical protein